MTDALDFDPTFEIDPEDYACQLDELATRRAKYGAYDGIDLLPVLEGKSEPSPRTPPMLMLAKSV